MVEKPRSAGESATRADALPSSPRGFVALNYFVRVLPYLRPRSGLVAVSGVVIVLSALVGLLVPWPLQILVDNVLDDKPLSPVARWFLSGVSQSPMLMMIVVVSAGLFLVVVQNALTVIDNYVNTKIDLGIVLDFRSDLFRHVQKLSIGFHDRKRSGQLIYATNFQGGAAARLVMTVPPIAQSVLTLGGMFFILVRLNWQLALISLTIVPFLYYAVGYYVTHIQTRLMEVKQLEGESLSIVHEAMNMLKVIVAFGRQGHEYGRFRRQGETANKARVDVTVRQTLFSLAVNTTTAIGTALVLGFGAYHVMQGRLTVGQLLVVMAYIAAVYKPLEAISTTVGSLQDVLVSLRLAFDVLDVKPEIEDRADATAIGRARGRVTFEGVNFSYMGRVNTLREISFDAEVGRVVAVVGPTGAGKSTLVSLIPRFYDPQSGRVLLDGRDTRDITLDSLRQQVSVVLQEPLLFSGTIEDNIRYGRLDATDEEIIEAAKAANAHDFISRLPRKYGTVLGERGTQISGGERQRISVARAFLKDAPVLILDEPTSSIDSKTESVILDALDRLMVGRTTFLIAHRLSTIRRADLILVIDQGRIVEQGTHEELLAKSGLYKQLHDLQSEPAARARTQQVTAPFPTA